MGRLAHAVIKDYIEKNPGVTLADLKNIFPDEIIPNGVVIKADEVGRKRFFPDLIPLNDGTAIAVNHEWQQYMVEKILSIVEKMDYWDKDNLSIIN